jgi:hypothetical protein
MFDFTHRQRFIKTIKFRSLRVDPLRFRTKCVYFVFCLSERETEAISETYFFFIYKFRS